jgi:hypothetical protein
VLGPGRTRPPSTLILALALLPLLSATFSPSLSAAAWVVRDNNSGNSFETVSAWPSLIEQEPYSSGTASESSVSLTLASATTTGDWLILAVADQANHSGTVSGVSGGGVTTWTEATGATGGSNAGDAEIWYGSVTAGSSTSVTVSFSGKTQVQLANVSEWSGIASSSPLDAASSSAPDQPATSFTAGPITTTTDEDLVVTDAYTAAGGPSTQDATPGYTQLSQSNGGSSYQGWAAYQDDTSTGNISAGWTASSSAVWATAIAAFKP